MKLKFYIVNALLLICSISVTVLFSELILKVFGIGSSVSDNVMNINENGVVLKSENPKLVYTFKPNFPNETSSQGFREDRVYQKVKNPGVSRIIALGDSVAYGVAVNVRKNFLSLLEERANLVRKQKIEIINMAISGYSSMQEIEFLKEAGLVYQPDEVWIFYVLNDPSYDGGEFAMIGKEKLLFSKKVNELTLLGKLRKNSNIWKLMETYLFSKRIQEIVDSKIENDKIKYAQKRNIKSYFHAMHMDEYFQETKSSFNELKELSQKHKFKVKVFIMPILENRNGYFFSEIHEKVKSILSSIGFEVHDLLEHLENEDLAKYRLSENDTLHLNESGHQRVEGILEQYLPK